MSFELQLFLLTSLAIVLFLGLRWLHDLLWPRLGKEDQHRFSRIFTALVGLLCAGFVIWVLQTAFQDQLIYPVSIGLLIVGILIGAGWFLIQDVTAGIILRLEEPYDVGDGLNIGDVNGRIYKIGIRSLWLVTEEGNHVKLPYRLITEAQIRKSETSQLVESTFQVNVTQKQPLNNIIDQIHMTILTHPACVISQPPRIQPISDMEDQYLLEISFFTLDKKYAEHIKNKLNRFIKSEI